MVADSHELVAAVKNLALELGRTPTRTEFENAGRGFKYHLVKMFRNYGLLLQAAGLETYEERRKITNAVFNKPIDAHLNDYQPRESVAPLGQVAQAWPKLMTLSDIHWPFHHAGVLQRFHDRVREFKPELIVLNGDAWDMYSHSKFPRSHNIFTPREEQERARTANAAFWDLVQASVPQAKCVQMLGNHDLRPLKRVLESYPEAEDWVVRAMEQNFTFKNVTTIFDHREEFLISDIAIFHGYRTQLGAHRDYTLMNCINGHTHVGGVVYRQVQGRTIWELNSGLAGDPDAKGLTYTPQKISKWTLGWGEVDHLGPRFIPFR